MRIKDILEKNRVGFCIENIDIRNDTNAINTIMNNKYHNNITPEIRLRYNWENQEERYLEIFKGTRQLW